MLRLSCHDQQTRHACESTDLVCQFCNFIHECFDSLFDDKDACSCSALLDVVNNNDLDTRELCCMDGACKGNECQCNDLELLCVGDTILCETHSFADHESNDEPHVSIAKNIESNQIEAKVGTEFFS